jgi:aldehyde dehydrogenase (NAD+)
MHKLATLMERDIDELAALETLDSGKPFKDCRESDLPSAIDCIRYYAGWADGKVVGQVIPSNGPYFSYTVHEPIGGERVPTPSVMDSRGGN